jgi:spoIIIJ-associated protein
MEDLAALAKLRLEEILSLFGLNVSAKVRIEESTIILNVEADSSGRLIGRHGETLDALQQLVNAIVRANTDQAVYISLDIADYKKGRAEQLTQSAQSDARKVIETGEPVRLRPMNAAERRVVHMALADISEVETESEGEGRERRVIIKPKS